nr:unnamed protein product [Callosobruchus analis]
MKENERKKYQMKKIKGTRKLVKDMDRREHKAAKRIWKEHCTTYRAKKKSLKDITNNFVRENTPDSLPVSPAPPVSPENVLTVARRQAKLKRERIIREKDRKIYHYKKKMEKYKKRLQRLEKGNSKNNPDTPNTKLQAMCDTPESPFWVFIPKVNARDTCVCIKHSNIDLKLSALHSRKILPYNSHIKLLENTCCNRYDEQCLSRICQRCINKNPHYREFDDSKPIQFKKWVAEKQVYKDPKSKQTRTVTKYIKKTFNIRPRELIENLQEELNAYYLHERNIIHQYKAVKALKQNISDKEAIIHMDFSENYCTKYSQEIHAYHFGGSRLQLSLHTVIIYTKGSTKPYCTVSQNTTHSPAAIWVHLQPIFRSLPPNITCVHFVSDGPVTQYRNKTMFYILASRLHLEVPNVEKFSWNFSESGHGKGAPDGVGAACKKTADAVVAAGGDIDSLESFVNIIQERCPGITMFTIDEKAIDEITDDIKKDVTNLKPFTGTLKIHQVKFKISRSHSKLPQGATKLVMKSLSCFCDDECQHFNLGVIRYEENLKLIVEDIYTDSENEDQANLPAQFNRPL